ncbi:MAG TPA: MerR family transcriptional regulator [Kofleriaceae bacterium]|nr:MerR family transcriptional regulator [Kofleriaceae bacterium]
MQTDSLEELWPLGDLVAEAANRLEALPAPKNGQVRAVPDERTVRYYAAQGLLDRPAAMRGRTALYNRRHLAQIVAIKRMQQAGHSLADIQKMWATVEDSTLTRISGVLMTSTVNPAGGPMRTNPKSPRKDFWKQLPEILPTPTVVTPLPRTRGTTPLPPTPGTTPLPPLTRGTQAAELRVEVAPGVAVVVALPTERSISISPADVHAVRVAAAAVVTELANRGLLARGTGTLEEEP